MLDAFLFAADFIGASLEKPTAYCPLLGYIWLSGFLN
jgi:hypothetical protein